MSPTGKLSGNSIFTRAQMPSTTLVSCQGGWQCVLFRKESPLSSPNHSEADSVPSARFPEIAEMIADGEIPIPVDWPENRLHPLLDLVHAARRRRLVHFIARTIASDIRREERRREQSDVT